MEFEGRCCKRSIDEVVVEIGALDHAGEHPSSQPESLVVDALAYTLLRVRSPSSK